MFQCELNCRAMSYIVLVQIYIVLVQCAICEKFLSSFPCGSKRFLNFRLSSTSLLINWFLIKNVYQLESGCK